MLIPRCLAWKVILFICFFAFLQGISSGLGNVERWEREFGKAAMVPADIYEDPSEPGEVAISRPIADQIETIEMHQFYSPDPRPEMTPLTRAKVMEALRATLTPELVDNDLADMVVLAPARFVWGYIGRSGLINADGVVFWATFRVDSNKFMILGDIDFGLTETVMLADFNSSTEFDAILRIYFNVPYNITTYPEYRPIRFNGNQFGFLLPDPDCDWGYSGYAVSFSCSNCEGFARSVDRKFVRRGNIFDTVLSSSIEYSIDYEPASNYPPLVDVGPDKNTTVNTALVFTGSCIDPEGDPIVDCYWDFGDGTTTYPGSCNEEVSHTYLSTGEFTATLWAFDGQEWGWDECVVNVILFED
jgi:hypothetical protein